ncbi:hypothetical protein ACOSQ2_021856 [Xanthoceras sorbifolium]
MESIGTSENVMQGKSKQRRAWTIFDEKSFLTVLEDFVANGKRCDTGNFKAGSLAQMEKALNQICPASNLKANPHLESKLKKWKKKYSTIYDMMNTNGFAWNDVKKCIEVDSNEAWESYVKLQLYHYLNGGTNHTLYLTDLLIFFGKDHANGKGAEVPSEMMVDIGNDEGDDVIEDASPISINKESNNSRSTQGKRKRRSSNDGALVSILNDDPVMMVLLCSCVCYEGTTFRNRNEDSSDIAKELKDMGLSPFEQIKSLKFILEKSQNISLFMSLDDEMKNYYADSLLSENM